MPVRAAWVLPWHLTWMSNQNLLKDGGIAGPPKAPGLPTQEAPWLHILPKSRAGVP